MTTTPEAVKTSPAPVAVLDAIRARAKAYFEYGTPGHAAPRDRAMLLAALEAVLTYGEDRKRFTHTGNENADMAIVGYAGHIERVIAEAFEATK
jgi:hypothetical protein